MYAAMYTWNWKTGTLDRLTSNIGMEVMGWVFLPGKFVHRQVTNTWNRYFYLVGVEAENKKLQAENEALQFRLTTILENAIKIRELQQMLLFSPPASWNKKSARVVGPGGNLLSASTLLVDLGSLDGVKRDFPVVMPFGVLGRIFRLSPNFSSVLLLTDPAINIAVIAEKTRTIGILTGQGAGQDLIVKYVPLNAPLKEGELLFTSGLGGFFPKGLPVAKIQSIRISNISLFKEVRATPISDFQHLENVLILIPQDKRAVPHAKRKEK